MRMWRTTRCRTSIEWGWMTVQSMGAPTRMLTAFQVSLMGFQYWRAIQRRPTFPLTRKTLPTSMGEKVPLFPSSCLDYCSLTESKAPQTTAAITFISALPQINVCRTRSHAARFFERTNRGQLCESTLKHDQQRASKHFYAVRSFGSYAPGYSPLSVPGQVYSQTNFKINFRVKAMPLFLGMLGTLLMQRSQQT